MTKTSRAPSRFRPTEAGPVYGRDVYSWALHQARLLREGRVGDADIENIAEELLDVGRSEYKDLRSALARIIQHLLKWDFQPGKRTPSWRNSVRVHRVHATQTLGDNPGLVHKLDELLVAAFDLGVAYAIEDSGLARSAFPEKCPYDFQTIMNRELSEPIA